MLQKLKNKILISTAIAGILYLAFAIFVDYEKVIISFTRFNWFLFPVVLMLSLANYFSRFFKWEYYLKILDINIKKADSLSIFMSGLVMSVTPGKFGELVKSYLLKQVNQTPISKSAPIVFAERATDFLSLSILAIIGSFIFNYDKGIVIAVGVLLLLGIGIISSKTLSHKLMNGLSRITFLKSQMIRILNLYDSSFKLLRIGPLILMTLLSSISWGFECFGYYIILTNFEAQIEILWSFFSYSFSTIIGAVSMLPGGLGVTEGSMTLMLVNKGLIQSDALTATFLVRIATLWFAVIVGLVAIIFYQKRFGKIILENLKQ